MRHLPQYKAERDQENYLMSSSGIYKQTHVFMGICKHTCLPHLEGRGREEMEGEGRGGKGRGGEGTEKFPGLSEELP